MKYRGSCEDPLARGVVKGSIMVCFEDVYSRHIPKSLPEILSLTYFPILH